MWWRQPCTQWTYNYVHNQHILSDKPLARWQWFVCAPLTQAINICTLSRTHKVVYEKWSYVSDYTETPHTGEVILCWRQYIIILLLRVIATSLMLYMLRACTYVRTYSTTQENISTQVHVQNWCWEMVVFYQMYSHTTSWCALPNCILESPQILMLGVLDGSNSLYSSMPPSYSSQTRRHNVSDGNEVFTE